MGVAIGMKILIISPYPEEIAYAMSIRDRVEARPDLGEVADGYDWIISYGCRQIMKAPLIARYRGRIINLHISYLPFGRGADPNFWAWFDGTPSGISIHQIDDGIDTGPIYAQGMLEFPNPAEETLRTTYITLRKVAEFTFSAIWPGIRSGDVEAKPQLGTGSYHRLKDKLPWFERMPKGYDTPVLEVAQLGRSHRCGQLSA